MAQVFPISRHASFGVAGEDKIGRWLISRGTSVARFHWIKGSYKGPRIETPAGELVTPDMLAFRLNRCTWIEAKSKAAFTWHRITETWQTGVDIPKWRDYLAVRRTFGFPVWLLFLSEDEVPHQYDLDAGSPYTCPTGLYGREVRALACAVDHYHDGWGKDGMVYFRESSFKRLATKEEVDACSSI